ncbi:Cytochrome oxidase biogenesis protein Sco1/SenC/PrrC, thiol-disulfide reductase involved in Cu(I) insertion into CoxII Cu(A) center [hydrothermal vent metagenome]|uniref:Cytochrome oxidase biogenesis protein Sco1/SenC/PrrC, thiol-disulfide reductase involved in Cu(I) insertion into CoxII Cu(A) center n=1 Tax=hydrothermal vent metagenome TaxID=652676 RepID=A0A3B0T200_9ZZZZ
MIRNISILVSILILALFGGYYVLTMGRDSDDRFAQCRASKIVGGAEQIGGPFTLISETGETVTDKDVIDKPSLIYFGYTFCPDVCPLDSARNAAAIDILESRGVIVKPVFISIDPGRDTPEVVAEFTNYLHPRMIGLTGSEAQVKAASKAYRTYYKSQKEESGDDEFYLMAHSTFTYLTFPEYGFAEFFRRDITSEDMADRVQCFIDTI